MKSVLRSSAVRYLVASVGGLALDFLLYLVLFHVCGVSLTLAAGISFLASGIVFYFVHELWTFKREGSRFAPSRMAGNLVALVASGLVRVAVIALLETIRGPEGLWVSAYFAIGACVSFAASFLLNRFVVFRRRSTRP